MITDTERNDLQSHLAQMSDMQRQEAGERIIQGIMAFHSEIVTHFTDLSSEELLALRHHRTKLCDEISMVFGVGLKLPEPVLESEQERQNGTPLTRLVLVKG